MSICFIYRKTEHRQRSKSYQPHKQVPSVDRNRLQQTKRALFKSPPNNHKRILSSTKSRLGSKKAKSDFDRTRIENSKRALWPRASKNNVAVNTGHDRVQTNLSGEMGVFRKRKREEQGMLTPHNTCARRMLFGEAAAVKGQNDFMSAGDNTEGFRTGENKPQTSVSRDVTGGLSEVHRKVSFCALSWHVVKSVLTLPLALVSLTEIYTRSVTSLNNLFVCLLMHHVGDGIMCLRWVHLLTSQSICLVCAVV